MCSTDHVHTWGAGSEFPDLRCAVCGASHSAIQTMLGEAADDARKLVGDTYYTGCRVRQESETLELWLSNAPVQVLQELKALRRGVYAIHNDAPRTFTALSELRDTLDVQALESAGVRVVGVGPTIDGHLRVAVMGDVLTAQATLDAVYGSNVAQVEYGEPIQALPLRGA